MSDTTWVVFVLVLIPVVAFLVYALVDLVQRPDMRGWHKTIWIAAVVLMPLVGSLLYVVFRPTRRGELDPLGRQPTPSRRAQELIEKADPDDEDS